MLATTRRDWSQTYRQAEWLYEKHAAPSAYITDAISDLPQDGFLDLWRAEIDGKVGLKLNVGDWIDTDVLDQYRDTLHPLCDFLEVMDEAGGPNDDEHEWVKIAFAAPRELPHQVKEAFSKALRGLGETAGYLPGGWADQFGGPTPLTGMLAGGLIGAGAGYGAGWLGEQVLPRTWRRGRLRNTLAVMGGLAGAAPGMAMVADNVHKGRDLNSGALLNYPNTSESLHYLPTLEDGTDNPVYDPNIPGVPLDYKAAAESVQGEVPDCWKAAASRTGFEFEAPGFGPSPPVVPLDAFNQMLYSDPHLSPPIQAAASGLLEAAYRTRGGGPRLITPMDVARISAGMGTGYLSGAIVGKALGALMGMPEPTQAKLRQTGLWAGIVANVVPLAFGAR